MDALEVYPLPVEVWRRPSCTKNNKEIGGRMRGEPAPCLTSHKSRVGVRANFYRSGSKSSSATAVDDDPAG